MIMWDIWGPHYGWKHVYAPKYTPKHTGDAISSA